MHNFHFFFWELKYWGLIKPEKEGISVPVIIILHDSLEVFFGALDGPINQLN